MGDLRLCIENGRLRCEVKKKLCPLTDGPFMSLIDWYFLCPIGPRSCNLCTDSKKNNPGEPSAILKLASVAVLFRDMEVIERYWATGKMTYRVCRELRHARNELNKRHRAILQPPAGSQGLMAVFKRLG